VTTKVPVHSRNYIVSNSLWRNRRISNEFVFLVQLSAAIYNQFLRRYEDNGALSRWFHLHRHLFHLHKLQQKKILSNLINSSMF